MHYFIDRFNLNGDEENYQQLVACLDFFLSSIKTQTMWNWIHSFNKRLLFTVSLSSTYTLIIQNMSSLCCSSPSLSVQDSLLAFMPSCWLSLCCWIVNSNASEWKSTFEYIIWITRKSSHRNRIFYNIKFDAFNFGWNAICVTATVSSHTLPHSHRSVDWIFYKNCVKSCQYPLYSAMISK